MKKLMMILLALMLVLPCAAYAEETSSPATEIPFQTNMPVDFGNAGPATVRWTTMTVDEYGYEYGVALSIVPENGAGIGWSIGDLFSVTVWASDLDSDGCSEILISGDIASDDFYTYCLKYQDGKILQLPFANTHRGSDYEGYADCGYGKITALGENTLTLTGSQDVLGTYFGSRTFSLRDDKFETNDIGLWIFDVDIADPEIWEYRSLKAVQPVPVTLFDIEDGNAYAGTLQPGERVLLTASDCQTIAHFLNEDGCEGYFTLEPNAEVYGWGSLIGGIPESELFEYVPYAD